MNVALAIALALALAAEGALEPPILVEGYDPVYPEAALVAREEGTVKLQIEVDERGEVARVDVEESAGRALDEAALGAATNFVFTPARLDGAPVRARVGFSLRFELPREDPRPAPPIVDDGARAPDPSAPTAAPGAVAGVVRHAGTVRTVPGAEIAALPDDGGAPALTTADALGRFALILPPGRYTLEVAATGYDPTTSTEQVVSGGRVDVTVYLRPELNDPFETTVRARRSKGEVSRITLSRDEVQGIPGTMGDTLRVIESLPGVARVPLFGGALIVRGGLPGDTSVMFDGVPIPTLFHFGALSSIVNPSFLAGLDFHPGGFPVEYGRATAGIVDVKSHELAFESFEGSMDVDMIDAGFFFGGPIAIAGLPRLDFAFGARRSYLEGLASGALTMANSSVGQAFGVGIPFLPVPTYDDVQLKLELRPIPRHRVSLFYFAANDQFVILGDQPDLLSGGDEVDGVDLESFLNRAIGSRFWRLVVEHEVSPVPGVRHLTRPFVGSTEKGLLSNGVVVQAFTGFPLVPPSSTIDAGVRDELRVELSRVLEVNVGLDVLGSTVTQTLGEPFVPRDPCTPDEAAQGLCAPSPFVGYDIEGTMVSIAGWAWLRLGPIDGLTLYPGVRVEETALDFTDARGEIVYADGARHQNRTWIHVDPRLTARFELTPAFAMKGAVGVFRQPPRVDATVLQTNAPTVDEPRAVHVIGGLETALTDAITLDAQVYTIRRDLILEEEARKFDSTASNASALILAQPGAFDSRGRGQTLGFELFLRHQPSAWFFGWLAYTFSRTWLDDGTERDPFHPAPFDSTHNFIAVGKLNLPLGFTFGARFQYATGGPSPAHDSITVLHDVNVGTYTPVPSTLRRPRLPDYQRLDVRLDRAFVFDAFSLTPYVELLNAYAYPNVEITIPGGDFRARGTVPILPGIPPILSFGLQGDF